jgi:protein-S-isoprenylcysteine O-methyltransferase Ste14
MLNSATWRGQAPAAAWRLVSTVALASVFAFFAAAHLVHWRQGGEPTGLGFVAEEALAVLLFLVRRRPLRTSLSPADWILATGGSWLIMLARPAGPPLFGLRWVFLGMQFVGLAGVVLSLGTLGRSFGIVAANRGLKTGGPYRVVRHPAYLCYLITQLGYVLENASFVNITLIVVVTFCQIGRIQAEERVLRRDGGYREYAARVRYRLLPGLY